MHYQWTETKGQPPPTSEEACNARQSQTTWLMRKKKSDGLFPNSKWLSSFPAAMEPIQQRQHLNGQAATL